MQIRLSIEANMPTNDSEFEIMNVYKALTLYKVNLNLISILISLFHLNLIIIIIINQILVSLNQCGINYIQM